MMNRKTFTINDRTATELAMLKKEQGLNSSKAVRLGVSALAQAMGIKLEWVESDELWAVRDEDGDLVPCDFLLQLDDGLVEDAVKILKGEK